MSNEVKVSIVEHSTFNYDYWLVKTMRKDVEQIVFHDKCGDGENWVILVEPRGDGKTEIISAIEGYKERKEKERQLVYLFYRHEGGETLEDFNKALGFVDKALAEFKGETKGELI